MLTGSPLDADDRVYSEPFSHLPPSVQKAINDSELFNKNRPVRSSRNRTAFKDSRTSAPYTAEAKPTKHDPSACPSPEHEPSPEGEGPLTQCSSLGGDGLSLVLPEEKVHQVFIVVTSNYLVLSWSVVIPLVSSGFNIAILIPWKFVEWWITCTLH